MIFVVEKSKEQIHAIFIMNEFARRSTTLLHTDRSNNDAGEVAMMTALMR